MSTPPEPPDETPEQTLARLQAGQSAQTPQSAGGAAPDPSAGLRFPQVRLREGYDIEAVDAFIRDIRSKTSEEIRRVQFPTRRLRPSYEMNAVDAELDRWEARQRRAGGNA